MNDVRIARITGAFDIACVALTFGQLALTPGPHHVELRATGYQTLTFDVNIEAGKTITYRLPMQRPTS